ncbi:carbohydrate ABC transporter permease [Paenibacillus pasadenensis]|uniref:Putative rhamnose oligosaccharide ABC transport system, permease component n=1 Tax=Paenibacillus pasadenensis TaxID=217090 RepID=A0A2N5N7F8_9BACL|nr:carbohydrate ABC transporter permease [Paenibacillus pasadenensis]PLT46253.1 putative rhamnose oligosaccharide ABC transport system, permease component [Paenibacillus pasadenensis]
MNGKPRKSNLLVHLVMIAACLVMSYPLLWWIGASFKSAAELGNPGLFPEQWLWRNYSDGWVALPQYTFTRFFENSLLLNATTTLLHVVSASLVAFGFARLTFPLKGMWFSILLLTLMLPGQVTLIPQYTMFHAFDWINTYLPLIVPSAMGGAFFIFLLVQFIRGIPRELDESAKIDGCSWFGIYARIVMPLTVPALITVMIFSFIWGWDDYFGPLIYLNTVDKYTVPLALRMFIDTQSAVAWGQLLAMSLLSVLPPVLIFFLAQKHFVEGIATSGLKG